MKFAAELCGDLVEEFGDGKCFGDVAREIARAGQMPEQNEKDLVRRDEGAVAIHGADAVAVAVGGKARVVFSGDDRGLQQRATCGSMGSGLTPPKSGSRSAADFIAGNAVAFE